MSFTSSVLDLFRFDGTTALVTGGNGGIGAAMVTSLAEAGADIIIIQISGDTSNFHETISAIGRKAAVYDCDLADVKCIRECIAKILSDGNVIDILINCAGVSGHRPILDIDDTFREKVSWLYPHYPLYTKSDWYLWL